MVRELKKDSIPSPSRLWYNKWVEKNAKGKVLDVGKSTYWDYGFPTLDINRDLNPTFIGNIKKTSFPDKTFNLVLCNGMYEFVDDSQKMIDEVLRIGEKAIFGFVGKEYKPYKKEWKFYEGKERLPKHTKKDFDNKYHFIICDSL